MAYKDLRDWLGQVEKFNQLKKISKAGWDLEMGAITELVYHEGQGTQGGNRCPQEISFRRLLVRF